MKILFLNPIAQLGGAERMLLDIMASLRNVLPAGSSMHLIALSDGPMIEAARKIGVDAHILPMPASVLSLGDSALRNDRKLARLASLTIRSAMATPALVRYSKRLRTEIQAIAPDVIHSNGIKTHVLSRFVAGAAPRAAIVWHVHDLLGERPLLGKVLRRFAGRTSLAIAISQAVAQDLRVALPRASVQTLLNAIDVEHFSPGEADTRELDRLAGFEHRQSVIRVGLIATYARWKGQDIFLDAATQALAAPRRPELRFYVIGGPIYATAGSQFTRAELSARAQRLGIVDHVGFVDFLPDPLEAYRALDIVVHASTRPEPFGRTIVEAMACGQPVIVARAGGAAELFEDGVDALGVAPNDPVALAEAVVALAGDPSRRQSLGDAARASAVERFDRRRLGPKLMSAYRTIRR